MKAHSGTMACAAALVMVAAPALGGWLPGYAYRQEVNISSAMTAAPLADFPALIKITDAGNSVFANAQSPSGYDIAFTAPDGTTVLPHEIEHFSNAGTPELDAWVKTNLSSASDTTLYMYYGKAGATTDPSSTATWSNAFNMVQHLEENSGTRSDSSATGNDATATGNVAHDPAGQADGCDALDGVTGTRLVVDAGTVMSRGTYTMSCWYRPDTLSGTQYLLVAFDGLGLPIGDPPANDHTYVTLLSSGDIRTRQWTMSPGSQWEAYRYATVPGTKTDWHHVAFVFDGPNKMEYVYVDGVLGTSGATTGTLRATGAINYGYLMGCRGENAWYDYVFDGSMDEVRYSDAARDADWIKAAYENQHAPGDYLGFGSEQIPEPTTLVLLAGGLIGCVVRRRRRAARKTAVMGLMLMAALMVAAGPALAGWLPGYAYRQEVTVSSAMTAAPLTDFPALIKITDAGNSVFANAQSPNGYDIAFTAPDGTTVLPHEIEHFSKAGTPELDAWVKTDLSSASDTTLYMYYGKSGATTDPSSTATWSPAYDMVQHLQETSGTRYDSTANGNDCVSGGGNVTADASGAINGAADFDGTAGTYLVADPPGDPASSRDTTTISCWFQPDSYATRKLFAYMNGLGAGTGEDDLIRIQILSNKTLTADIWTTTPGGQWEPNPDLTIAVPAPDTGWHQMAFVFDGPSHWVGMYMDGVLGASASTTGTQRANTTNNDGYLIGASGENELYQQCFVGSIDEVRVVSAARDADWIKAAFENQHAPGDYLGFGSEQIPEPTTLVLLAAGLLGCAARRRRRNA